MATIEGVKKERANARRKELNARKRYRTATRRGHDLADRHIPVHDQRRVKNLRKRLREAEAWQAHRRERRQLDRWISVHQVRAINQVDDEGLDFIILNEGLRLEPYNDSQGHATIGVGHLIHRGPVTDADRRRYANFTREDAMALLAADLDSREAVVYSVTRVAKIHISQRRFNALVSFTFNIGNDGFKNSTAASVIKQSRSAEVIQSAIMMWNKPPEIITRRRREAEMFRLG